MAIQSSMYLCVLGEDFVIYFKCWQIYGGENIYGHLRIYFLDNLSCLRSILFFSFF